MLYSFDALAAPESPTNEELMRRIRAHDRNALTILFCRHKPLLRSLIGRTIGNVVEVDDVLQQVLLEIWNHAAFYSEDKGNALGWIVTLARRRAIERFRKNMPYSRARDCFQVASEEARTQPFTVRMRR